MRTILDLNYQPLGTKIKHQDPILLVGSCFSQNIGKLLQSYQFKVLANPTGILFDPLSIANHFLDYANKTVYQESDFFYANELFHSWRHHSDFSNITIENAMLDVNLAINNAGNFLIGAKHLIVTLGTAFSYQLIEKNNFAVANCHRQNQDLFEKKLLSVTEITDTLETAIKKIRQLNPNLQIIFTVSPVRHARDGLIANNRSKGRLLEAVHLMCEKTTECYYFPSYELIIDILRDHRYYDVDLVHPNYLATQYVFDYFIEHWLEKADQKLLPEIKSVVLAAQHRPRFPETKAHQQFKANQLYKLEILSKKIQWVNWDELKNIFKN